MVVALPPLLNDDAGLLHGREFFEVQAFVSALAIKALDVTILPRAARLDVRRAYLIDSRKSRTRGAMNSGLLSLRMNC